MLIKAGHTFDAIQRYTPAQIALFARIEVKREANERVSDARIAAIGAQAGFGGKLDALRALENQVRKIDQDAGASKVAREVSARMRSAMDQMRHQDLQAAQDEKRGGQGK